MAKRIFSNVFGSGFIETSHARRRMIDSVNDGLQPDFVYNYLCIHIPKQDICIDGVFEKLIRIPLLMNI